MKEELERKHRVIDMLITMHSILYHRNKRLALWGNLFLLITAIFLNVFVFFDYEYLKFLNLNETSIKTILGIASIVTFALSIVFLIVDWNKKAEEHKQAINQLSELLNELRYLFKIEDPLVFKTKAEMFNSLYNLAFESIPPIPNNKFNPLKAKHYFKVELSKYIDKNKGVPYSIIRIKFFLKNLQKRND